MGIRDKPIAPASPWQNGFAERLIGSLRRECLDHIIVLGEAHLRRILKSYAEGTSPHPFMIGEPISSTMTSSECRPSSIISRGALSAERIDYSG